MPSEFHLSDPLSPQVRRLFATLTHAGELTPAGAAGGRVLRGEAGREAHGTRVRFMLRVPQIGQVEVRYRAYGCPHTLATCEWLARELEGRRLDIGQGLDACGIGAPAAWAKGLGIPPAKLGRLLVIEDALRAALDAGGG